MTQTKLVSYSELDNIRQCRLKHQLGYLERWSSEEEAPSLSRGKRFHSVMERYYRIVQAYQQRGHDPGFDEDVIEWRAEVRELLADPHTANQSPEMEQVEWMVEGYRAHYGTDADWEILEVEANLEGWLPTTTGGRSSFRMKGKIDLVVHDRTMGGIWIVDHKTCKNLPKQREIDLDDQFGIYEWLMRKHGHDVRGIIYNAVRHEKLKSREMDPSERFKRVITIRGETELQTMAVEAYELFRDAYRGRVQGEEANRDSTQPLAPRSPDGDRCGWRCNFTEQCLAGRKGRDIREMLGETGFVQNFERH